MRQRMETTRQSVTKQRSGRRASCDGAQSKGLGPLSRFAYWANSLAGGDGPCQCSGSGIGPGGPCSASWCGQVSLGCHPPTTHLPVSCHCRYHRMGQSPSFHVSRFLVEARNGTLPMISLEITPTPDFLSRFILLRCECYFNHES